QNDIQWYIAEKQSDGTYKVKVSIANHKYHYGEYKIHTYLTDGNGFTVLIESDDLKIQKP
ncbi:GBS Bsp-like repeat-containing protein, partial [Faecalitalea cylindroides]